MTKVARNHFTFQRVARASITAFLAARLLSVASSAAVRGFPSSVVPQFQLEIRRKMRVRNYVTRNDPAVLCQHGLFRRVGESITHAAAEASYDRARS